MHTMRTIQSVCELCLKAVCNKLLLTICLIYTVYTQAVSFAISPVKNSEITAQNMLSSASKLFEASARKISCVKLKK